MKKWMYVAIAFFILFSVATLPSATPLESAPSGLLGTQVTTDATSSRFSNTTDSASSSTAKLKATEIPTTTELSDPSTPVANTNTPSTKEILKISTPPTSIGTGTKASNCIADQSLPDSACTPGAILTTDTSVICVSGYTQTVRDVPDSERQQVFAEYGIDYRLHSNYEVDHLISLELGGSNDIANLWPEPHDITNGSYIKDKFENYLHAQACEGVITMQQAQYEIATNWVAYGPSADTLAPPLPSTSSVAQTATGASDTATATPAAGTYYTSSYGSAKYYYPAACPGWKSLSPTYLKAFDTLEALLAAYPTRTLSPQCQ